MQQPQRKRILVPERESVKSKDDEFIYIATSSTGMYLMNTVLRNKDTAWGGYDILIHDKLTPTKLSFRQRGNPNTPPIPVEEENQKQEAADRWLYVHDVPQKSVIDQLEKILRKETYKFIIYPVTVGTTHATVVLLDFSDPEHKQLIYVDPYNTGNITHPNSAAAYFARSSIEAEEKIIFSFMKDFFNQCLLSWYADLIAADIPPPVLFGDGKIEFVSVTRIMLECQLFIEGSRRQKAGFTINGYCVPLAYYITEALIRYRPLIRYRKGYCIRHFIKHFLCDPRWDDMGNEKYLAYLVGETFAEHQVDVDEDNEKRKPKRRKQISYAARLAIDFNETCRLATVAWNSLMKYAYDAIVTLRDERCAEIYKDSETYSGLPRSVGYYGWLTFLENPHFKRPEISDQIWQRREIFEADNDVARMLTIS